MSMRSVMAGLGVLCLMTGCGPEGSARSESRKVVADSHDPGADWPLLLQHCLRSPNCDPMSDFGQGLGQASGSAGQSTWFVETADVVKEGGRDYGGAARINLYATRGQGGAAGRPVTMDETASNLRSANARRS